MKKKTKSILALILSVMTVLSLILGAMPIQAQAVTQSEIDALKKERDRIAEEKAAQQAIVDELEAQHASVLERKLALDDRNVYTLEQMELNEQEIALYDQMIEDKAKEVEAARALEEQQLERYRTPCPRHGGKRKLWPACPGAEFQQSGRAAHCHGRYR